MKKKGFTLIELIAAMAIFAIGMTGVSMGFTSASKVYSRESHTQKTINSAQSILQAYKGKGKDGIYKIFNDGLESNGESLIIEENNSKELAISFYVYFNYDELDELIKQIGDYTIGNSNPGDHKFTLSSAKISDNGLITGSYEECNSKNKNKKNFAAYVKISKYHSDCLTSKDEKLFKLYKIEVTCWSLMENKKYESYIYTVVGR